MSTAAFIAGDWGTSHLRLSLCDSNGSVLDRRSGPGVAALSWEIPASKDQSWAERFTTFTEAWTDQHGSLPALLCGTIGSNIGWTNVPYVACPTPLDRLAEHLEAVDDHIFIAAGLSCINRNGAPDVMRGEETQIIGAMHLSPSLRSGRHLLCLPGTHTKWALIEDGTVIEFVTAVTGEMFGLIKDHSVLVRSTQPQANNIEVFKQAIAQLKRCGSSALLQLLFECRSRQIAGKLHSSDAAIYLSGLLISADVLAALQMYDAASLPMVLIGAPQLTQLYAIACRACGVQAEVLDGSQASLAGLASFYPRVINNHQGRAHE